LGRARLGVALLLAGELAHQVDGLRRALGDPALGRIAPHLTLVPPVNVAGDRLPEALALVRAAAAAVRGPLRVRLGPPASFQPVNPVVHLPAHGAHGELAGLRAALCRPPLARPVSLPFVPHVTLADGLATERIGAALAALAGFVADARFDAVTVLREGPGRVWTALSDAAFARPAVIGRGGLELELAETARPGPDAEAVAAGEAGEPFALTARRDGVAVGLAAGRVRGDVAVLERLVVGADHRGEGIGSHLLAAVESLAARRGCDWAVAAVPPGGPGRSFLAGRGWRGGRGPGPVLLRRSLTGPRPGR